MALFLPMVKLVPGELTGAVVPKYYLCFVKCANSLYVFVQENSHW